MDRIQSQDTLNHYAAQIKTWVLSATPALYAVKMHNTVNASLELAANMEQHGIDAYVPRYTLSAGYELNRANETKTTVQWASISSEDARIQKNVWYSAGKKTPPPDDKLASARTGKQRPGYGSDPSGSGPVSILVPRPDIPPNSPSLSPPPPEMKMEEPDSPDLRQIPKPPKRRRSVSFAPSPKRHRAGTPHDVEEDSISDSVHDPPCNECSQRNIPCEKHLSGRRVRACAPCKKQKKRCSLVESKPRNRSASVASKRSRSRSRPAETAKTDNRGRSRTPALPKEPATAVARKASKPRSASGRARSVAAENKVSMQTEQPQKLQPMSSRTRSRSTSRGPSDGTSSIEMRVQVLEDEIKRLTDMVLQLSQRSSPSTQIPSQSVHPDPHGTPNLALNTPSTRESILPSTSVMMLVPNSSPMSSYQPTTSSQHPRFSPHQYSFPPMAGVSPTDMNFDGLLNVLSDAATAMHEEPGILPMLPEQNQTIADSSAPAVGPRNPSPSSQRPLESQLLPESPELPPADNSPRLEPLPLPGLESLAIPAQSAPSPSVPSQSMPAPLSLPLPSLPQPAIPPLGIPPPYIPTSSTPPPSTPPPSIPPMASSAPPHSIPPPPPPASTPPHSVPPSTPPPFILPPPHESTPPHSTPPRSAPSASPASLPPPSLQPPPILPLPHLQNTSLELIPPQDVEMLPPDTTLPRDNDHLPPQGDAPSDLPPSDIHAPTPTVSPLATSSTVPPHSNDVGFLPNMTSIAPPSDIPPSLSIDMDNAKMSDNTPSTSDNAEVDQLLSGDV